MLGLLLEVLDLSDLVVALPLLGLLLSAGLRGHSCRHLSASSLLFDSTKALELLELPKLFLIETSEVMLPSRDPFEKPLSSLGLQLWPGEESVELVLSADPLVPPLVRVAPGASSSDMVLRGSSQLHEIELLLRLSPRLPLLLELELLLNLR